MKSKKTAAGKGAARISRALPATLFAVLVLAGCADGVVQPSQRPTLTPARFSDLPGWSLDQQAEAVAALRRSCPHLSNGEGTRILTSAGEIRTSAEAWRRVCVAALGISRDNHSAARSFFEHNFDVLAVSAPGTDGKFTGYYEPVVRGSRVPSRRFTIPVYRRPPDLEANKPYLTRTEIESGALRGRGLELAYVDDAIGLFEMQVQGSGRIALAEGGVMRVGFDGSNNQPYTALGRVLVEEGALPEDQATWPAIRNWLQENPAKAREAMRKNERYIFFKDTRGEGAIGAQGVTLTSGRSMAVDPAYVPYGLPVYIDTTRPAWRRPGQTVLFRRLMVAQDTGSAIKGPVRGDVFFGAGSAAADSAGRMNSPGRWWILLPKEDLTDDH